MDISHLAELLHRENCSCVISNGDRLVYCHRRGVIDLYAILTDDPALLSGALIADKVIGKGAAALMIAGGVRSVYAAVISRPALSLFESVGLPVSYGESADSIINRSGTGFCPVETLCRDCSTADECIPLIARFISENNRHR